MSQPTSPKATPKRKRDDLIVKSTLQASPSSSVPTNVTFSFEPPKSLLDDGSSSPRTKVAHRLRDLSLGSGGGVGSPVHPGARGTSHGADEAGEESQAQHPSGPDVFNFNGTADSVTNVAAMQVDEDDDSAMRKRHKPQEPTAHTALTLAEDKPANAAGPVQVDEHGRLVLEDAVDPAMVKLVEPKSSVPTGLKKSYPSINRLADSKSRARRRTGTPPLGGSRRKSIDAVEEPVIVDPIRAALTWHEDEITVYDAEDKDDDGTGLNGIGFKPTPAIAYQRAQKRKKQLSEYKKREEREARALRNQRRREAIGERTELIRKHSLVRVHFSDVEPESVVTT